VTEDQNQEQRVVVTAIAHRVETIYDEQERDAIGDWLRRLLEIRESSLPAATKARLALQATDRSVIVPLARHIGQQGKRFVWTDRTWAGRLGLGAAGIAAVTTAGKGAGIAALGGAIGVPLWIVFGAGGSFAGMLLDELGLPRGPAAASGDPIASSPETEDQVLDAEWTFLEETESAAGQLPMKAEGPSSEEPLWTVFKSAYRSARKSQREKTDGSSQDRHDT
jgi:hypothetical protein